MKKPHTPRKPLIAILLASLSLVVSSALYLDKRPELSRSKELYVRDHVVQLTSPRGSCSGVQVRVPSGRDYILTASHCKTLIQDGSIYAAFDGERPIPRRVVEDSRESDLMLLEALPGRTGLVVASGLSRLERITALTHALGLPTRLDEGEFLLDVEIQIPVGPIETEDQMTACVAQPKYKALDTWMGGLCVMQVTETISSIHIEPGSSGGPAVNTSGELVGIASAGNQSMSAWVTLKDVKQFLAAY
jgi:S1-C subfamily serine protease